MIYQDASNSDNARADGRWLGSDPATLRETLRKLAGVAGFAPDALVEWCSADVPGAPPDVPALYYAAFLPGAAQMDMPLGLGDTPVAALVDLLWMLGGPALLAEVRAERTPAPAASLTREAPGGDEH